MLYAIENERTGRMKTLALKTVFFIAMTCVIGMFLFSCVVTLTDAQGAFIFILSIPAMVVALVVAWAAGRAVSPPRFYVRAPKILTISLVFFFVMAPVPILNIIPSAFLQAVGAAFETATGKTPHAYFADKKAFDTLLVRALTDPAAAHHVDFSVLDVIFAWDRVCVFGPYTNNAQARTVLKIDFNIEDRSTIAQSDSVNALVFLYDGRVNKVVDLKRDVADFAALDTCYARDKTVFTVTRDPNGRTVLKHIK